jgi:outer membrane protein
MKRILSMPRSLRLIAAAAALSLATPAAAQQPQPEPTPITLDEAVARALGRSPALAQASQQVENAATGRRTAYGAFLPTLSASSGASLRSTERFDPGTDRIVSGSSDSYNAGINAGYDLFTGGRRFAELDRSGADMRAAEARREDQRFQVTLQTKQLFFTALRQGELLDVARSRLGQAEESLEMTRRQARLGMATTSDTLRARLEMVNARQAVLTAETQTRAARFALARQVGEPQPVVPTAPADLEPTPLPLSDAEVLEAAEMNSPGVLAAAAATGAAGAAYTSARTAYLPTLRLSTGYSWANEAASFNDGNTSWSLSLSGSLPIFNGFQREATIARAEQTRNLSRLQEDDARLAAREEADGALRTLTTAGIAIEIAAEAVAVAEEDLRVVRERYRVGVATVLDVVTSQIALDQARVNLVGSRYDYVMARAQLEAILGREL